MRLSQSVPVAPIGEQMHFSRNLRILERRIIEDAALDMNRVILSLDKKRGRGVGGYGQFRREVPGLVGGSNKPDK